MFGIVSEILFQLCGPIDLQPSKSCLPYSTEDINLVLLLLSQSKFYKLGGGVWFEMRQHSPFVCLDTAESYVASHLRAAILKIQKDPKQH